MMNIRFVLCAILFFNVQSFFAMNYRAHDGFNQDCVIPNSNQQILLSGVNNKNDTASSVIEKILSEKWNSRTDNQKGVNTLDHIRLDSKKWLGYNNRLYIQYGNSWPTSFLTITPYYKRNESEINKLNSIFDSFKVWSSSKQDNEGKATFYSGSWDITNMLDFSYNLMPWANRHPYVLSTLVGAGAWLGARWYYNK